MHGYILGIYWSKILSTETIQAKKQNKQYFRDTSIYDKSIILETRMINPKFKITITPDHESRGTDSKEDWVNKAMFAVFQFWRVITS